MQAESIVGVHDGSVVKGRSGYRRPHWVDQMVANAVIDPVTMRMCGTVVF